MARECHAAQHSGLLRCLRHHRRSDVHARGGARDHLVTAQKEEGQPRGNPFTKKPSERVSGGFFVGGGEGPVRRPTARKDRIRIKSRSRKSLPKAKPTQYTHVQIITFRISLRRDTSLASRYSKETACPTSRACEWAREVGRPSESCTFALTDYLRGRAARIKIHAIKPKISSESGKAVQHRKTIGS